MRLDKVEALGRSVIHDICSIGMTMEEVAVTFDCVISSLENALILEELCDVLGNGVVGEAEEILKEAFEDVDKQGRD